MKWHEKLRAAIFIWVMTVATLVSWAVRSALD